MSVSREQYGKNFDAVFGKDEPIVPMCQTCGKPPGECNCITLEELAERMGIRPFKSTFKETR
jgi:hypothetical protein